jgi:lysophospholipase L1-like esterase
MPPPKALSERSPRRSLIVIVAGILIVVVVAAVIALLTTTRPSADDGDAAPSGTVVAFYGDSYTFGDQASSPDARWSSILCEQQGWFEVNPSVNGLGFVANRFLTDAVGEIIEADPDLIIVTMGLNDTFIAEDRLDELETAIIDDFRRFRSEAPQARLVVVEPFWIPGPQSAGFRLVADAVEEAAAEVDADFVAGAGDWLAGHPEWRADEPYRHPNDAGYAEIARRMTIELESLGVIGG